MGGLGDGGTARVGKTKDFCYFVEDFADGIIACAANNMKIVMVFHSDNLSVAAGNDKGEERKLRVFLVEPVSVDVRFKMVNSIERFLMDDSESTGGESADEETTK